MFPVFKFLSSAHADKLLTNGNIHIPRLIDFRNDAKYSGTVLDKDEGSIRIVNQYTHYSGLAKDANGILPLGRNPYERIVFFGSEVLKGVISPPNSYAYCATQHFFSDSVLHWAKERGKDTCVLITDFEKFVSLAHDAMPDGTRFLAMDECRYIGHVIHETNPVSNSLSNFFLTNPVYSCFVKPVEHRSHREVRAVWLMGSLESYPEAVNHDVSETIPLFMRVDYSSIRAAIERGDDGRRLAFGARIHKKSGGRVGSYEIRQPAEVCSPLMWRRGNECWHFGFRFPPHVRCDISDVAIANAEVGVTIADPEIGEVFCDNPYEDIDYIEFFCN
jgi:hypothetical protein